MSRTVTRWRGRRTVTMSCSTSCPTAGTSSPMSDPPSFRWEMNGSVHLYCTVITGFVCALYCTAIIEFAHLYCNTWFCTPLICFDNRFCTTVLYCTRCPSHARWGSHAQALKCLSTDDECPLSFYNNTSYSPVRV